MTEPSYTGSANKCAQLGIDAIYFEGDYNRGTCSITSSNGSKLEFNENFFVYGEAPIKNFLYEELGDLYCSPSFSPSDRDQYLSTITSGMGNEQLLKLFDYLLAIGRYRGENYLGENQ